MSHTAADYEPSARAALALYGLEGAVLTLLSFSENGTYLATLDGECVVIRVHRPGYNSLEEIRSELAWMESVRTDSTIRTPRVRAALDGSSVVTIDIDGEVHHVDVFEYIPGMSAESEQSGIKYNDLGAITAKLHKHVQKWTPPVDFARFRWDLDSMLGAQGRWGDWRDVPNLSANHRDLIETAEKKVRQRLERFGTGPDRFGLVHADLRMSNLIVQNDEIVVIDFDDCGWSWFLTDLAAVITFEELEASSYGILADWLAGYCSVSRFDAAVLAEIPTFIMLRRLMVTAWVGSHPEAEPSRRWGANFASNTATVANLYLTDPTWMSFDLETILRQDEVSPTGQQYQGRSDVSCG